MFIGLWIPDCSFLTSGMTGGLDFYVFYQGCRLLDLNVWPSRLVFIGLWIPDSSFLTSGMTGEGDWIFMFSIKGAGYLI